MMSTSAWRRAPIWRSTKVVEAGLTGTKELHLLRRRRVRHSDSGSSPLCIGPESFRGACLAGPACTVGEHTGTAPPIGGHENRLLLSRGASPRRYGGLRDSWGGFAPTAPACTPAELSRRRSKAIH